MASFADKPAFKKFMSNLYGWGAAIVIVGALFKINHYPGANLMLIVGMSIEAIIFIFSTLEKQHAEFEWDRVYPALRNKPDGSPLYADGEAPIYSGVGGTGMGSGSDNVLADKLQEMLEKANVTPEVFDRLSSGLEKLTETTTSLSNLTSVVSINKTYADEMAQMTANLNQLNQFYVNQLQVSKAQTEAGVKLQEDVNKIMETLSSSLESSQKYRQEIDDLSQKVATLNKMYGQMLSAMQMAQTGKN
ncbi:MAG: gliding motility protein GldL [Bacteroides sp.]|nr:gliding motility protein GldL [Bacteroides sp.]MCM1086146.1 gliding motility protein GldL [Bacteroides sp.]MCM1169774.1 gliding motility protein GldL [Bacteroides sp.]